MSKPATKTVADRLAAAGVRVRPLVWEEYKGSYSSGLYDVWKQEDSPTWFADHRNCELGSGTRDECIAACEAHHAASVLAMLEVVPSEEVAC